MLIKLVKAVITSVYASKKSTGVLYLKIQTTSGSTFDISTRVLTEDRAREIMLQPLSIEGELRGSLFDGRQRLELVAGNFQPVALAVPAK